MSPSEREQCIDHISYTAKAEKERDALEVRDIDRIETKLAKIKGSKVSSLKKTNTLTDFTNHRLEELIVGSFRLIGALVKTKIGPTFFYVLHVCRKKRQKLPQKLLQRLGKEAETFRKI